MRALIGGVMDPFMETLKYELKNLYNALVIDSTTAPEQLIRSIVKVSRESVEKMLDMIEQESKETMSAYSKNRK